MTDTSKMPPPAHASPTTSGTPEAPAVAASPAVPVMATTPASPPTLATAAPSASSSPPTSAKPVTPATSTVSATSAMASSTQPPRTLFAPISQEEIATFADKLAQSGANLSPAERALLNMVVGSARALTPEDVRLEEFRQGFTIALSSVLAAQALAWGSEDPNGWARIDPIWVKGNGAGAFEVSATVATGSRQAT